MHQPTRVQQGEGAFAPFVPGILSGLAAVGLLVAVGRWLLRKWLLPVRKVKVPPSGATPWERVRPTSPQESQDGAGYRRRASSSQEQQFHPSQAMAPMSERERAKNAEEML